MTRLWDTVKSPGVMAVVAILSILFSVYQFFHERKPRLVIETEAISSVFSVLEPVGGLQVSYGGVDLRLSKQALWLITAAITNNGDDVIRNADYDPGSPFSIAVEGGRIVDNPEVITGSDYIDNNLNMTTIKNRIIFSPVILEPKDGFRIRLLVLSPEGVVPSLMGQGKIAGISEISNVNADNSDENRSWWDLVTDADQPWVHPVRSIVYGVGGIIAMAISIGLVAAIVVPLESVNDFLKKKNREKRVKEYRQGEDLSWKDRALAEVYIEFGENALAFIYDALQESQERIGLLNKLDQIDLDDQLVRGIKMAAPIGPQFIRRALQDRGLLRFEGPRPVWEPAIGESLDNICSYLGVDVAEIRKRFAPINARTGEVRRFVFEERYRDDFPILVPPERRVLREGDQVDQN